MLDFVLQPIVSISSLGKSQAYLFPNRKGKVGLVMTQDNNG